MNLNFLTDQELIAHCCNYSDDPVVKGPVSDIIGWGCHTPDLLPYVTFFERQHSMCESHTFRDKK